MNRSVWIVLGLLLVAGVSVEAVLLHKKVNSLDAEVRTLRDKQSDLEWDQYVLSNFDDTDYSNATVGVIQFLKRGYSIEFETVNFTQDGLYLAGQFGNPTNLTLQNLTLTFTARPYFTDEIKKKWETNKYPFWNDEWNIGSGQTGVIPIVLPKTRFPFRATIPNVKQTKEGFRIVVSLSGERYSY